MSEGYLEVSGASDYVDLKIGIGDWKFVGQNKFDKESLPSRTFFAIDLGERNPRLTVQNAYATSCEDWKTGMSILDETSDLTIRVRRNDSEYIEMYNEQTGLTLKSTTYQSSQVDYGGNRFVFKNINFEVVG